MQGKEAIRQTLESSQQLLEQYVADFTDAELNQRPVPKANSVAWQLAHLVEAEGYLGADLPGAQYPEVPVNMKAPRDGSDVPGGFAGKAALLEQFKRGRGVTMQALERLSDGDLDKPSTGSMAKYAPTLGAMLILMSNHVLMHAGQFTVARRALNKPVLF